MRHVFEVLDVGEEADESPDVLDGERGVISSVGLYGGIQINTALYECD